MEQLLVVSLSTRAHPQMTQTSYPVSLMMIFSYGICATTGSPTGDQQGGRTMREVNEMQSALV
jgi:hypothetical protein